MKLAETPVQVKLPEEVLDRLREESEATGIPVSVLIRADVMARDAQRRGSSVSEGSRNTTSISSNSASQNVPND